MKEVLSLGIMSGSSLDGVDLALAAIAGQSSDSSGWKLKALQKIAIPKEIKTALAGSSLLSAGALMALNAEFGKWIGREIRQWLDTQNLQPEILAFHGHTVFHEPDKGFSFQLGNGAQIAFETQIQTLTNVRAMDMAAGGRGAPYAPLADRALFPGYDAYLNLGGISNLSINNAGKWSARDCGVCNQLLNLLAGKAGLEYDFNGNLAAKGTVIDDLLTALTWLDNSIEPQQAMSNQWVREVLISPFEDRREKTEDLLATAVAWSAHCIARPLKNAFRDAGKYRVLVSGGGAFNKELIKQIQLASGPSFQFILPADDIIEYKEALLMAYLGYLYIHGMPANLAQTSGAKMNCIQGSLYRVK